MVRLERLGKLKKSDDLVVTRTRDLLACSRTACRLTFPVEIHYKFFKSVLKQCMCSVGECLHGRTSPVLQMHTGLLCAHPLTRNVPESYKKNFVYFVCLFVGVKSVFPVWSFLRVFCVLRCFLAVSLCSISLL
jgi:hypothetical protein